MERSVSGRFTIWRELKSEKFEYQNEEISFISYNRIFSDNSAAFSDASLCCSSLIKNRPIVITMIHRTIAINDHLTSLSDFMSIGLLGHIV
jgi:hypothetical protein